jgi:hypothetical protein
VTVVTDLGGAHPTWFHREVDLCFVPSDPVKKIALDMGLKQDQVRNQQGICINKGKEIGGAWVRFTSEGVPWVGTASAGGVRSSQVTGRASLASLCPLTMRNPRPPSGRDLTSNASCLQPAQIRQHGLPIRPGFWKEARDKATIRHELGVKDARTALVVGGGDGIGDLVEITKSLAAELSREEGTSQVVVICGKNEAIRAQLAALK